MTTHKKDLSQKDLEAPTIETTTIESAENSESMPEAIAPKMKSLLIVPCIFLIVN